MDITAAAADRLSTIASGGVRFLEAYAAVLFVYDRSPGIGPGGILGRALDLKPDLDEEVIGSVLDVMCRRGRGWMDCGTVQSSLNEAYLGWADGMALRVLESGGLDGTDVTEGDRELLRRCIAGESSVDEVIAQVIAGHTVTDEGGDEDEDPLTAGEAADVLTSMEGIRRGDCTCIPRGSAEMVIASLLEGGGDVAGEALDALEDAILESEDGMLPVGRAEPFLTAIEDHRADDDTHAFAMLIRRGLETGLSKKRLLEICGTYRDLTPLSKASIGGDSVEMLRTWMQNYAFYVFRNRSDDPVVAKLLEDRRERLDRIQRLIERME